MMTACLVISQIPAKFGRCIRITAPPSLVIDYLGGKAEVGIDVGDKAIDCRELLFGIVPLAADMYHLDTDRPRVHAIVGSPVSDGNSPDQVIPSILDYSIHVIMSRITETRMVCYTIEPDALDD